MLIDLRVQHSVYVGAEMQKEEAVAIRFFVACNDDQGKGLSRKQFARRYLPTRHIY
jgi:hypothetical protein